MGKGNGRDGFDEGKGYDNSSEMNDNSDSTDNISSNDNSQTRSVARKSGTLDNGTTAFMQWLDSVNKRQYSANSLDSPLILRKFVKDNRVILYDKNLESEIDVEIEEGVPFCRYCNLPDCSHVGFTISLEQLCEDYCSNQELSIDDIVGH